MATDLQLSISQGDLAQIVNEIFNSMLNLEVLWDPAVSLWEAGGLTAAIEISGCWNGTMILACEEAAARRFAGRYLAIDPRSAADDLVADVLGELANMIVGNLKSALGQGLRISTPRVATGEFFAPAVDLRLG